MAMKTLGRMSDGIYTKVVYKFVDGKLTEQFESLDKAAKHSTVNFAGLSRYMLGKMKKPGKIPANVEYSYKSYLPKPANKPAAEE